MYGPPTPTAEKDPWAPERERLTKTTIILGLICPLLFIAGVCVQQYAEPVDGYVQLLKDCILNGQVAKTCQSGIETFHEHSHSFAGINLLLAIAETLKATSIALLVTLVVSNTMERENRRRLNSALSQKARQISLNVFDGLFGNSHPPATLEAIKDILQIPIIRDRLDITYTLTIYKGRKNSRIADRKFVRVDAVLSAVTRNIADPKASPSAVYELPIGLSLPNPLIDELKSMVTLDSVKIEGRSIDDGLLKNANVKLQQALADDKNADAEVDICVHRLLPGHSVRVQANYTMMKELEDTEVLRSRIMAQALSLTVIDKTNESLAIRARAIHTGKLDDAGSNKAFLSWELNEIILPQQGIMVWWKQKLLALPAPKVHSSDVPNTGNSGTADAA